MTPTKLFVEEKIKREKKYVFLKLPSMMFRYNSKNMWKINLNILNFSVFLY